MTCTYWKILLPLPHTEPFDYSVAEGVSLKKGQLVRVSFRSKELVGVAWQEIPSSPEKKLKMVKEVLEEVILLPSLCRFIEWVSDYTLHAPGSILRMVMPVPGLFLQRKEVEYYQWDTAFQGRLTEQRKKVQALFQDGKIRTKEAIMREAEVNGSVVNELKKQQALRVVKKVPVIAKTAPTAYHIKLPVLSEEQQKAVTHLKQMLHAGSYHVTVLEGVTGSGKTEVYFTLIAEILSKSEGQVLIMLPEIALTSQLLMRFEERFGSRPAVWHSDISAVSKRDLWCGIEKGEVRLVVGARSALFLPFRDLRLIVVDEEHEAAYKQEDGVIYHGRDMAIVRAYIEKIPIILASATPALETLWNVQNNKYTTIHLASRYGKAVMPDIEVVDMRVQTMDKNTWISPLLRERMAVTLANGQQSLLFLNRRGYAPLTLCRACGHRMMCANCASWLVEHKSHKRLECHHCGYHVKKSHLCPECGAEESLVACGPGVERIAEEVSQFLPEARVLLMTRDSVKTTEDADRMISSILRKEVDVIIGTQMIAKGHHFPHLTLVGIIDADLGLAGGDLRAAERTYQLLQQVSGRAGRAEQKGRVYLQSYMPENTVIQALAKDERQQFIKQEMQNRKVMQMPPYARLVALVISGKKEEQVVRLSKQLAATTPLTEGVRMLGPVPAPLSPLRGRFRYRLLVKSERHINVQQWVRHWLSTVTIPAAIHIKIDVDPYHFL